MACILSHYRKDGCASCSKFCQHRIAMSGYDGNGGAIGAASVPKDYRHLNAMNSPLRESNAQITKIVDAYIKTFKRQLSGGDRVKSLYLWSENPGTGKTTTAATVMNEWLAINYLYKASEGKHVDLLATYFLDVNELQTRYNLATMMRDEGGIEKVGEAIKRAQTADFVVLDDVGVRDSTEAFTAYIHSIINARTTAALPTIYTSNLPMEDMAEIFSERTYDRIRDQCVAVPFKGESKRGIRR